MTYEGRLLQAIESIESVDESLAVGAWARLDSLTKPPRSLGRLETLAARCAAIQGTTHPDVDYRAIVLAAADHGVVAEGVSAYPQDVTWQMVMNFVAGGAAINQLAATADAELWLVDVGVAHDLTELDSIRHAKIARGTRNMAEEPAMTREEAARALMVGVGLAEEAAGEGVRLLGTGEMGIGNTTAAAALTAAYTGVAPETVVGPGTGLDDEGVAHKAQVVARALAVNNTAELDALGILAAVGGLEIACLAGIAIGAAAHHIPVVIDGFISSAAALAAVRIAPACADYLIASHRGSEPGHRIVLDALELDPVLEMDLRLGEGTGAALAFNLVDAACRMLSGMATFDEAGVSDAEEA